MKHKRQIRLRSALPVLIRGVMRYAFGKRGQRLVTSLRLFYGMRMRIIVRSSEEIGRLARGREVRFWVDGKEAFSRIERLIRRAEHSLIIQMFIWKDDETGRRIAQCIVDAADRGVAVNITKEAVGDMFEFHQDFLGTKESALPVWKRFWSNPRIKVTYGTQGDHAKVYVIDGHTLLLTGMNIADEYRYTWHDYLVELRGARFVEQYLTRSAPRPHEQGQIELYMNSEEAKRIRPMLMKLLREARENVFLEHCYLSDPEVLAELVALTHRRVRVTLLVPESADFYYHANMQSVGYLLAKAKSSHINVLLYPGFFHSKILLVDHDTAFMGSANLMKSSLDDMGEVNVLIRGKHRALWKLREALRHDTLLCRAISSPPSFLWLSRWLAWLGL